VYETVDVLASAEVLYGFKEYSQSPTIPQLYLGGTFVGGSDIVREMHARGELAKLLGVSEVPAPVVTISAAAAKQILGDRETPADEFHLKIDARFTYGLFLHPREDETDAAPIVVDARVPEGAPALRVVMDRATARRADGLSLDLRGNRWIIESPHEPPKVKQLRPSDLKAMMDAGQSLELLDVRTKGEREVAKLPGSTRLDEGTRERLEGMARDTMLVFMCLTACAARPPPSTSSPRASPRSTTCSAASRRGRAPSTPACRVTDYPSPMTYFLAARSLAGLLILAGGGCGSRVTITDPCASGTACAPDEVCVWESCDAPGCMNTFACVHNPCGTGVVLCDCAAQLCVDAGFTSCGYGPSANEIVCSLGGK
jgi:monothiol glutaredoxin